MNANLTRTPTSSANGQYAPPTTPSTPTLSTHNQTQGQTYSPFVTTITANNGLSFPPPHPLPADEPGSGSPLVSPRSGRREAGRVSRGLVAATMSHSQSHRRENGSSMVDSTVILGDGGDEPQQQPKKFRLKMASDEVSHVSSSSSLSYPPIPIPIPTNPVIPIASQHNGNNAVTADSTIHGTDPGRRSSHASTSASSELRRSQRRLRGESETNGIVHDSHTDSLSNYSHSHSGSTSQSGSQSDSNSEEELDHSNEDSDEGEGEEGDLELPPLVVSAEVRRRIVEEEDAKRSRKIADLEISNQSLMTINRTLEADVARKNRLISGMKRQLRASGQQVAPLGDQDEDEDEASEQGQTVARGNEEASDAGNGRPRKSRNTRPRRSSRSNSQSNSEQEDDDISAFLLATRAHSSRLSRLNDHVESLITRGREAGMRVAAMQEGGRGKVWGVLELGERDAQGNEEEDRVTEEDMENGEGEQGIGVELVDARTHPDSLSGSDEVSSEDSVRDRGAVD
ncbi:hypothetical protein QFC21_003902 [Naganishia friedmannii]|uniref:Uncharacterized protein n=1 Tax=Naganishia friedmannii TaxID=89922 RepID=A0ACC2VLW0_9TREE|nr:hypothetical protein QFC21_003902 [Naganishia friedmannii]